MAQQTIGQGPGNLSPEKEFKTVKNTHGAAITKGQWVAIDTVDDNGYTVVLADVDAVGTALAVGVVADASIADDAFGRIQVSGFCDYATGDTNVAAGDFLAIGSTAGTVTGYDLTDMGTPALAHFLICGQAYADDASGVVTCMIHKRI